jgi:hypothetical protein
MKKMVLAVIIALCASALYGQRDPLDDFFNTYSDQDGYTVVNISGSLFGLLKKCDDDPDMENMDQKITSVRIVSREGDHDFGRPDFKSDLKGVIRRGGYEELMKVNNPDEDVLVLVKTDRDIIKEILVIASGDNEAVVQIKGNLTRDDVEHLSLDHEDGLATLEELETSWN